MNPTITLNRVLKNCGAVRVYEDNHLVYLLPNGNKFTRSGPDNHRTPLQELRELRRALKESSTPPATEEVHRMPLDQKPAPAPPAAVTEPAPPAPTDQEHPLKARIEAAIAGEEATQERLLAEAAVHERKAQMLKTLLPFADDATEEALRGILPVLAPVVAQPPTPPRPPEPPQQITDRVQVTRQLVLAATQTFDDQFTVNDVVERMTGSAQIDPPERQRVRSSVAQAMATLFERGEVVKDSQGIGRQQTLWRKASLNGNGTAVGTRA
ncbi:MAG TPA: hypothetical protein VFA33_05750 [Bryobacteraceae bacterium]|nr:hypothetical protein [Bryobacteraceae bacterium]